MKTWQEIRSKKFGQSQLEHLDDAVQEDLLELDLKHLREALGLSQVELANRVGITQSQLSKLERRDNYRISTLRRYVQALGGSLEINAVVNGKRVRVSD